MMSICIDEGKRTLEILPAHYENEGCRKVGARICGFSVEECYQKAVKLFGMQRMSGVVYYKLEPGFADQDFNDSLFLCGHGQREVCVSFWEIA